MNDSCQENRALRWLARVALLALAAAAAGCLTRGANPPATAASSPAAEARYKVVADTTPFYKYGPQQANDADQSLKKDTELTMVKRAHGFSEVALANGDTGYVGTEDIRPLSADEIAAELAAQQQQAALAAGALPASSAIVGEYTIPPEAGHAEQLPVPDASPTPKAAPTPALRY